MRWLSSLRSRIFLSSALLAVLSIGAAIYLVSVRVTRELENSLNREILSTRRLVEQLRSDRTRTFTTMARLIADTPKLKAAVDTDDPPTVQDTTVDYQSQLNSNLLLVTNKSGQVLATIGVTVEQAEVVASQPAVRTALTGHESFSLMAQPAGILQIVTVPIAVGSAPPDILGALGVGFLFDDALAGQLKEITGSEMAFGMDGRILASTLPADTRPALASLLVGPDGPSNITLGTEEFVATPLPLEPAGAGAGNGAGPVALILRSRAEQVSFLQAIHTELAVTAVFAVLLATLLSFAVARTITTPLAAITGVMRDVAATGDLTRKIVLRGGERWDDEDARLLATTFNTLTDSIARFQREISHKERLSSLGRLSTVIAHEVRNPLMIIKAALHTIRGPEVRPDVVREAAADIDEEVGRLNRIVNDVLDFARPIRFELAPVDLNAICREAAVAAQAGPGAPVTLDLDLTCRSITADAERLRLALVNLLINARHAVTAPLGMVRIATRCTRSGIAIIVGDNGVGIAAPDLARVFDPYFTTKRGGTGLGLPIAKNIFEGLGGMITVTSEPGRGTEIRIDFTGQAVPARPTASQAERTA
jgi:signal transduction histidine kinase